MALGIYEEEDIRAIANRLRRYGDPGEYTVKQMADGIDTVQVYSYNAGHSEGITEGIEEGKSIGYEEGKSIGYAEGKTDGIEEGKKSQYDEFWDNFQENGARRDLTYAFAYWTNNIFNPKYNIIPKNADHTLFGSQVTSEHLNELIKRGIVFDFSKSTLLGYAFASMTKLTEIPFDISLESVSSSTAVGGMCSYCGNLVTIRKIKLKDDGTTPLHENMFLSSPKIENITFEGVIGQNGLNLQPCKKLTHDSLIGVINILKDFSGTDTWKTIALGADNLAKLTPEELEIMDTKQWNYS